jgi:hypothetical protein
MSKTEFHTGRLYPVKIESSLEETCKSITKRHNIELREDWREDFIEKFNKYNKSEHLNEEYFINNELLYRVIDHVESIDEDYSMRLSRNPDGSILFIGQFYNSGTCFSEMLDEALNDLKPSCYEQFNAAIEKILEDKTIKPPLFVSSSCLLLAQHIGLDESIRLIEGIIKEKRADVFKASAYEASLDYIKKELKR